MRIIRRRNAWSSYTITRAIFSPGYFISLVTNLRAECRRLVPNGDLDHGWPEPAAVLTDTLAGFAAIPPGSAIAGQCPCFARWLSAP